jgi:hypothetical protein
VFDLNKPSKIVRVTSAPGSTSTAMRKVSENDRVADMLA